MSRKVRISLPADVADALVEERLAVRPLGTRGAGLNETLAIAVDAINTGSAVVSIVVAVETCRRLALETLRRRRGDSAELTITIAGNGDTRSLTIDGSAPGAEDKLFDFFVDSLNVE